MDELMKEKTIDELLASLDSPRTLQFLLNDVMKADYKGTLSPGALLGYSEAIKKICAGLLEKIINDRK
jgi:hypothetical protein